jgi:hypothetical protein
MPFYVSPEQAMKDKADYARKGIARGRNSVVVTYDEGILFVAPNPSSALHKVSEIYDRIAFAAVGRYNEYENLRVAGVRFADTRAVPVRPADVTARGLANWYAQILGIDLHRETMVDTSPVSRLEGSLVGWPRLGVGALAERQDVHRDIPSTRLGGPDRARLRLQSAATGPTRSHPRFVALGAATTEG